VARKFPKIDIRRAGAAGGEVETANAGATGAAFGTGAVRAVYDEATSARNVHAERKDAGETAASDSPPGTGDEIPKAAPPSPPPTVSKWMTLFEWLKTFDSPDFNLDFSFRRLAAIGFRYVMQTTDGALLSDIKDTSGSMSVPNYWVYSITITDGGESEMWIQASEGAPHDEPLKQMEEGRKAVEEIEETNQRARDYSKLLEGHYSWWARGQNGEYNFIGIGVIHA